MERISGVKIMKTKIFAKVLSGVLCTALTLQIAWGVKTEAVNAESYETDGLLMWMNNELYKYVDDGTLIGSNELFCNVSEDTSVLVNKTGLALEVESSASGTLGTYETANDGNGHRLGLQTNGSVTIKSILLNNSEDELVQWSGILNSESVMNNGTHSINDSDCSFSCSGTYTNNGTIELDTNTIFSCGTLSGSGTISVDNEDATLNADTITINSGSSNSGTINVTSSLTFSGYDTSSDSLGGTFVCNRDTWVSSDGATFTLTVGDITKVITGSVDNLAEELVYDDPNINLGTVTDVYYGQDYDFSDLIGVADGYDESLVYLEYSTAFGEYTTTKPTYPNTYYVRAVAPDYGTYLGKTSETQRFTISFLPLSELYPDGTTSYFTVSGIVNGKYVPGDLILTLPDGILFGAVSSPKFDGLKNTVTLTQDEILYDDHVNEDTLVQFRRASDNATTNSNISLVSVYPDIKNLIFDKYDPDIWLYSVDDEETDLDDNHAVTGDVVKINVFDENLKEIYINGSLYESYEEGQFAPKLIAGDSFPDTEDFEPDYVTLTLSSVPGEATDYTIKAVDYAGKETSYSFTLNPNTTDADISVSVPGTIFAGDDYSVDVKTNSDGEVTLQYKDASTNTVLSTKPTSAGKYSVTATAEETDFYFETSASTSYTIIKRAPDTTLSVPSVVYVGDDYDVKSTTDSDGNVTYQYYDKNNGSYLNSKPASSGEYIVTARTTETSKYYSSEDSASFKIIKRDPTISLSIPDTTIGQTYSPELVTNSDSTSISYEYKVKDAADSTYSKTKPITAGSYTIRVTIGSTDKFNGASATDNFTISKKTPSVSLGVGTPYAGTTYKPSFTSNSDAADKAVFEYKEKNADDSKYSTTLPTAYGEYVVRVTIPESAEFAKTTVTADFKIIYLDAPQTAYVTDGQSGKNNFFVSDVVLKAPTGYTISSVYGGPYTASIPYKDGITSVYLKRTSDNALTTAIPIKNAPRVDKNGPSISAQTGTITPGAVMYASDFILNVSDPNLRSLKVNGEAVDLKNYKDGYTLTLNPGYGSQTYKIMAEDEAGNVTTIEFTLKAEWLKDKVIIPDVVLPLEGNESYNLGNGYWLVTRNTPEGPVTDNTVYSGNMPFYVNEGGDYTFTKVI